MATLIGIFLIELLVVLAVALYVDCRRPSPPFWANDTVLYVAVGPALVAILAFGVALVVDAANDWTAKGIDVGDIPLVVASVVITAVLIVVLKPRKRLARYASMQSAPATRAAQMTGLPRLGTDPDTDPHLPKAA